MYLPPTVDFFFFLFSPSYTNKEGLVTLYFCLGNFDMPSCSRVRTNQLNSICFRCWAELQSIDKSTRSELAGQGTVFLVFYLSPCRRLGMDEA